MIKRQQTMLPHSVQVRQVKTDKNIGNMVACYTVTENYTNTRFSLVFRYILAYLLDLSVD